MCSQLDVLLASSSTTNPINKCWMKLLIDCAKIFACKLVIDAEVLIGLKT